MALPWGAQPTMSRQRGPSVGQRVAAVTSQRPATALSPPAPLMCSSQPAANAGPKLVRATLPKPVTAPLLARLMAWHLRARCAARPPATAIWKKTAMAAPRAVPPTHWHLAELAVAIRHRHSATTPTAATAPAPVAQATTSMGHPAAEANASLASVCFPRCPTAAHPTQDQMLALNQSATPARP
jgi:hypothetical protein